MSQRSMRPAHHQHQHRVTAPTVKTISGWVSSLLMVAAAALWLLRLTPLDRWIPDVLPYLALFLGWSTFLFVFLTADSTIKDKARPDVLRRAAPSLGLTYTSEGASGLPHPELLRAHVPERVQHVLVGSHANRELVAAIGQEGDSEGTDYMWCVMVELPVPIPRFGIRVDGGKLRSCRDWPPRSGPFRRRKPEPDPVQGTFLSDPSMRSWLEGLDRSYHFHVDERWVGCRGPKLRSGLPDSRGKLQEGLGPVLKTAKRFVDLVPNHVIWSRTGPWVTHQENR